LDCSRVSWARRESRSPSRPLSSFTNPEKIKEAIAEYDKVIKTHPKLAEAYFNRGNAYYDLGANQPAIKDYTEAIRLNPKDAEGVLQPRQCSSTPETRPGGAQRLHRCAQA
jgi:tetratricopeptide (TPR) repeat protein